MTKNNCQCFFFCCMNSIWPKNCWEKCKSKRCHQHQAWCDSRFCQMLSVSLTENKRIQCTYTETHFKVMYQHQYLSISHSDRRTDKYMQKMCKPRVKQCTSTKMKLTRFFWGGEKKINISLFPLWNISSVYRLPPPLVKHVRHHRNTWLSIWTPWGWALFIN